MSNPTNTNLPFPDVKRYVIEQFGANPSNEGFKKAKNLLGLIRALCDAGQAVMIQTNKVGFSGTVDLVFDDCLLIEGTVETDTVLIVPIDQVVGVQVYNADLQEAFNKGRELELQMQRAVQEPPRPKVAVGAKKPAATGEVPPPENPALLEIVQHGGTGDSPEGSGSSDTP